MDITNDQWTLKGHKGWVLCVEWDSTEKTLATGGHDGQVSPLRGWTFRADGRSDYGHLRPVNHLAPRS
jgi:ribosome assembly protein 4